MEEAQGQNLIKLNPQLLVALSKGGISISVMPKDILVLECGVAGTSFRHLVDVEKDLKSEVKLELKREPKNKFDELAIALHFKDSKIGYIPRERNEVIARLMDAGKSFYGLIVAKEWEGNWLRLDIKVFLKD